jgi:hypothetical protein
MLRHPAELRKGAATFAGLPLLSEHDASCDYKRDLVIGSLGTDVQFRDPYLICDEVMVWDPQAVKAIRNGRQRALSLAYHYRPVMWPGRFRGEAYDGIMTEISGTHCALVYAGRAGAACVI